MSKKGIFFLQVRDVGPIARLRRSFPGGGETMVQIRKAAHWLALVLWCAGCFAALSMLEDDIEVSVEGLATAEAQPAD